VSRDTSNGTLQDDARVGAARVRLRRLAARCEPTRCLCLGQSGGRCACRDRGRSRGEVAPIEGEGGQHRGDQREPDKEGDVGEREAVA
jgi:hypothetical protein